MSATPRSLFTPGIALATAGVVALAPGLVPPRGATSAQPTPELAVLYVEDLQLAGVGRDIYDSVTEFVQYLVESAQFWIDLIPDIGPPLAQQVGINYFTFLQPVIANTVYYISDLIADPASFVQLTVNYGSNLFYVGYNWVSAQAQYFGLPGLTPIPQPTPLAAVPAPEAPALAAPVRDAAPADQPEAPTGAAQPQPDSSGSSAKARADRADRRTPPPARGSAARRAATTATPTTRSGARKAAAATRAASQPPAQAASETTVAPN